MAKTPRHALPSLWRDRILRQFASGFSAQQFCRQGRFSLTAFYRWKSRLGLSNRADLLPAPMTASVPPSPFLPVTVRLTENAAEDSVPIEADLPNGIRLRIPTANVRLACRLVRAVAGAKTDSGGSQ